MGQLIQVLSPVEFLPPIEYWQGSALPYELLFCAQLLIIVLTVYLAYRIFQGTLRPKLQIGQVLFVMGLIYFFVMFMRLVLGLTILSDQLWFARPIPALFHLVLAAKLLTVGHFLCVDADKEGR